MMPIGGYIAVDDDGTTVGYVLPIIPDDASHDVREGIARRRITALNGECPCGARVVTPNRETRRAAARRGQVLAISVKHEADCPAGDTALAAAVGRQS